MPQLLLLNPGGSTMARRHRSRNRSSHSAGRGSFARPLSLLLPSAVGAAGALAVNGIVNYAPIPDTLKAGNMIFLTRAAIAIALGMLGPKVPVLGKYAGDMAKGALVVTISDFGKVMALQQGYNLSGLGYIGPARVLSGPGMYVQQPRNGMMGAGRVGRAGMYVNR